MSEIAFVYDEKKNPRTAFITGIPLRDLTVAKFDALTADKQEQVRRAVFFVAQEDVVKPKKRRPRKPVPPATDEEANAFDEMISTDLGDLLGN